MEKRVNIYINPSKAKAYLILLVSTLIIHLAFNTTKCYHYNFYKNDKITQTKVYSKEQFESLLKIFSLEDFVSLPKAVEVKYLYILPEKSILFIYVCYIIGFAGLILSIGTYNVKFLTNQERLARIPNSEKAKMMFLINKRKNAEQTGESD